MGNSDSKLNFRKAVVQLTTRNQPIDTKDELFWEQLWTESLDCVQDIFTLMPAAEVRSLRDEAPSNLATLCYKAVEKLATAADTLLQVDSSREQQIVLNCVRLLTRLVPYIFEDPDWRGFFWTCLPGSGAQTSSLGTGPNQSRASQDGEGLRIPSANYGTLGHTLLISLCDLLFCPDFTVHSARASGMSGGGIFKGPDGPEEVTDSCELIWEPGVGCAHAPPRSARHDAARTEILKLLLTLFSDTMYQPLAPSSSSGSFEQRSANRWLDVFTSTENRHALPLFTSLLNTICGYDPYSSLVPLNHLLFEDSREPLVEVALQLLIVTLDHDSGDNLFVNYLSRVHRDHDLELILSGFTRLLNNPLQSSYLPTKKIQFHQELLVLFWKACDHNRKFLFFVLKSSAVLNILVPTLYHLNEARADQCLVHIGVFILLLLSGERNFGVRLNKPYTASVSMDVPLFSGTHADLLILVFHRMITTGHSKLQPLFDCLLTIIVNVSPYLKSLSMVAASKLLHLLEAFSTPWFLYSNPNNHHLVFFLLEVFNNIIQYQFDGNSNLVYTIIRKRNIFHILGNLPTDRATIQRSVAGGGMRLPHQLSGGHRDFQQHQQPSEKQARYHQQQRSTMDPPSKRANSTEAKSVGDLTVPCGTVNSPTDSDGPEGGSSAASAGNAIKSSSEESQHDHDCKQVATLAATPRIEKMTEKEEAHKMTNLDLDGLPTPPSPLETSRTSRMDAAGTADGREGSEISGEQHACHDKMLLRKQGSLPSLSSSQASRESDWTATSEWVISWKAKLPLQTIMRLLQVLVPQVEKICIDKGLTDESEILKFLQHGTLVGLLPVPHPILIRKYQANAGTALWFKTYMWGVIYLRNTDPPIWYDTHVQLFQIHTL
ncbi:protein HID1-like isoform X2 [Varroa jacobsoni]|uniref:protein HID1-like isoform X2 n=1 Tax=Varroa jacobsoni TaxID=62625 RepID=UPI000BF9FB8E|nr:protein HID1-like isoform X2 [Varroa jacobsoni]